MSTPRLNVQLDLETPVRQSDEMGGYRIVWQRIGSLWVEMKATTGTERGAEVGPESVVSWRITTRGARYGDSRRPAAGQRLRMGPRRFVIEAVAERDPTGLWLTCFAREEEQT